MALGPGDGDGGDGRDGGDGGDDQGERDLDHVDTPSFLIPGPPQSTSARLPAGSIVDGKYRIVDVIGEGGMGVVYAAEHVFLRKLFALKLLRSDVAAQPEAAARLEHEARATGMLEHENVVRVTDFGRTPQNEMYLVMELLSGTLLADVLAAGRTMAPRRALAIGLQIARGLEAAHDKGIIHRDMKPENVFLTPPRDPGGVEGVKLLDFGIAKFRKDTSVRMTSTGMVMGTPLYMSPEQARGAEDIDHRVDLHAVGVILYELMSGHTPYSGDNINVLAFELLSGKPRPLVDAVPGLDPMVSRVVMKAFSPDRDQRYQTAHELRLAIEELLQRLATGSAAVPARPGTPSNDVRIDVSVPAAPAPPAARAPSAVPDTVDVKLQFDEAPAPVFHSAPILFPGEKSARTSVGTPPVGPARPVASALPPAHLQAIAPPARSSASASGAYRVAPPEQGSIALAPTRTTGSSMKAREQTAAPAFAIISARQRNRARLATGLRLLGLALLVALAAPFAPRIYRYFFAAEVNSADGTMAQAIIRLDNLPPGAEVYLDGVRSHLIPLEIPQSDRRHEVRVEAEGYEPRAFTVVAMRDQTLDARLKRARK